MSPVTASFAKPFEEQVAAFRLRLANLVPTAKWDDLWQAQHDRGFMVAGAVKADLLADLAGAVDKAIAQGTTLEQFRRDFRATVEKHGWHGWTGDGSARGEAWRTKIIYRTNMATSYAAGRWAQLLESGVPYIIYLHGNALEPRQQHLSWHGLVLPVEHPFWQTHAPPNGWGCTCYLSGARSMDAARRRGGDPDKQLPDGWQALDGRTGAPVGIDKGWDYAPGASVAREISALTNKLPRLPAPIGAAMVAALPARTSEALAREFGDFVDTALSSWVEQRHIIVGALKPSWVDAAQKQGIRLESAEIAVTDQNVQHTFRGTGLVKAVSTRKGGGGKPKVDPLDLDWFKRLPVHLTAPRAVLLDTTQKEPVFLLVFDVPGRLAKLVIELNTPVKKAAAMMNTVQSGRLVDPGDIRADIARGILLIDGNV